MKPDDVFELQLVDNDGHPIALAWVSVSIDFFMHGNHRYGFRLDPTNHAGRLTVRYDDVERKRLASLKAQPWDYKTRLEECDSHVVFSVPSQDELDAAVKVATSFNLGIVPPDAEWWSRASNRLIACESVKVNDGQKSVNILCARLRVE
jgi:hypothetical protein